MHSSEAFDGGRLKGWLLLAAAQSAVCAYLFHDFLAGDKFFAYLDVGSDTYGQFVPQLIHLASPSNWSSAWSFNVGLGALAPMLASPFVLLGIAGGPDHILGLRIWVYIAKIFVGGAAFYGFALTIGTRRQAALIVGLSYSFCCFIVTDGQWDTPATEFAAYAVILWALAHHLRSGGAWAIPLAIAFAAYCGVFMFSVGVFVLYVFAGACIASERPRTMARTWLTTVLPQCAIGLMLAAPVFLPSFLQILDSPRLPGMQAGFSERLGGLLSLNDTTTVLVELAGLFHKNMLGIGNRHFGWMNYLESPGFYVGLLPLLVIPQLWRGGRAERRMLVAGCAAITLFILVPAIRYAAFGFSTDYFRINNLWLSMLLLALCARTLNLVATKGVDWRLLIASIAAIAFVLWNVQTGLYPRPSLDHQKKLAAFGAAQIALLALLAWRRIGWTTFAWVLTVLVAMELAVVNLPSYHAGRDAVTRDTKGYFNDGTMQALAFLRSRDPGFHRIEKTYDSVSFCDAMAQGYMGVKSYWFQSAPAAGFFLDLGLISRGSRVKNYTNWLPNFGDRYMLNTLAGVKYVIADKPVQWPGFRRIHREGRLSIYENELAMPLGMVHTRQYAREAFMRLALHERDLALLSAAIVDHPRANSVALFAPPPLTSSDSGEIEERYPIQASALRKRGLVVEAFSPGRLTGRISTDAPGILVFSIPFSKGWNVAINGVKQPAYRAHLGMLATDVPAGSHRVEAGFALPGLASGLVIGLLGLCLLGAVVIRSKVRNEVPQC